MLLSIIIPAYNAERYIKRTIESVLQQTYQLLQIIIVDDGSTDKTASILNWYAKKDNRIEIIHKENEGLSSARNAGLEKATGNYVFFLDSDDWLEKNYLETCMEVLKKKRVDVLFTPYIREYKKRSMKTNLFDNSYIEFSKEMVRNKLLLRLFGPVDEEEKDPTKLDNFNTAWGKFYNRKIIKNIKFEPRNIVGLSEDLWFNINIFYFVNSAIYLGNVYLHYNKVNDESLVSTYHPELASTRKNVSQMMRNFARKYQLEKKFFEALNNRIVLLSFSDVLSVCHSNLNFEEKQHVCKQIIYDDMFRDALKAFSYKNMKFMWKIFYKLEEIGSTKLILLFVNLALNFRERVKRN